MSKLKSPVLLILLSLFIYSCKSGSDDAPAPQNPIEPEETESVDSTFSVSTLFGSLSAGNLVIGPDNYVYASDFLGTASNFEDPNTNGHTIRRFDAEGNVTDFRVFQEINTPTGIAFDANSHMYISYYKTNKVVKMDKNGIILATYNGINGPTGIVYDLQRQSTYVASDGGSAPNAIKNIYRISSNDQVSVLVTGNEFNGPNGLVQSSKGDLYVSNWYSGDIHKVSLAGTITRIATLPRRTAGWMAISQDTLYVTDRAVRIFKVTLSGEIIEFAGGGTGSGGINGPASKAQFISPNGIAVSREADTIYVSETERKRIRMIVKNQN